MIETKLEILRKLLRINLSLHCKKIKLFRFVKLKSENQSALMSTNKSISAKEVQSNSNDNKLINLYTEIKNKNGIWFDLDRNETHVNSFEDYVILQRIFGNIPSFLHLPNVGEQNYFSCFSISIKKISVHIIVKVQNYFKL